jgi:hypothetical protein
VPGRRHSPMAVRLLLALLLAVPGVLLTTASPAHACSCVGGPPEAGVRGADLIFLGTVTDDRGGNGIRRTLTFEVDLAWKGQVTATTRLGTGAGGGDCGLEITEGDETMVFAYREDDGTLGSNICHGRGATHTDVERLLGPGAPPVEGTPGAGPVDGETFLGLLARLLGLWLQA